jgi:hypothetical protein
VGPRVGLNAVEKNKNLALPGVEPRPVAVGMTPGTTSFDVERAGLCTDNAGGHFEQQLS